MTPMQRQLYDLLARAPLGDRDVPIVKCYAAVYGETLDTSRDMQMALGPLISRINRHLSGQHYRIEPGRLKNTYRLNTDYRG